MFSLFNLLKVAESATSKKELFIRFTVHAHCILMPFYNSSYCIPHFSFDGRKAVLIVTFPGHRLPVTVFMQRIT